MTSAERLAQYRACAARGLSKAQTAREVGVSWVSVDWAAKKHGISFAKGSPTYLFRQAWSEKDKIDLAAMWARGMTAAQIAEEWGVTRNSICGALHRMGRKDAVRS